MLEIGKYVGGSMTIEEAVEVLREVKKGARVAEVEVQGYYSGLVESIGMYEREEGILRDEQSNADARRSVLDKIARFYIPFLRGENLPFIGYDELPVSMSTGKDAIGTFEAESIKRLNTPDTSAKRKEEIDVMLGMYQFEMGLGGVDAFNDSFLCASVLDKANRLYCPLIKKWYGTRSDSIETNPHTGQAYVNHVINVKDFDILYSKKEL